MKEAIINAPEFMEEVLAYGADAAGIADRFMGNDELFLLCFDDFMAEKDHAALRQALDAGDIEAAFEAAHALKGVSANLGLTPYHEAICALVESLRAKKLAEARTSNQAVERQYRRLESLRAGKEEQGEYATLPDDLSHALVVEGLTKAQQSSPHKRRNYILIALAIVVAIILLVGAVFLRTLNSYQKSVVQESAQHLEEICNQLRLYTQNAIDNDWKVVYSVGDSIMDGNFEDDDVAVYQIMQNKRDIWGVTDLALYTADGFCIRSNGSIEKNDVASDQIVRARKNGDYYSIINSNITYTIPIETNLHFNGSPIVAIAAIREMGSFLDGMGFSSFGGSASLYLADEDGIVISKLSSDKTTTFNIINRIESKELISLEGEPIEIDALLKDEKPTTSLLIEDDEEKYIVATSIATRAEPLMLVYIAPKLAVNETMGKFDGQLISLSIFMAAIFAVFTIVVFFFLYRTRERRFDEELLVRDQMFNLLVTNTQMAFALFDVRKRQPLYISSNAAAVFGKSYFMLETAGNGFVFRSEDGESDAIRKINEQLASWNGKNDFRSGYIQVDDSNPPRYFEVRLFAASDEGNIFVGIAEDVTSAQTREETAMNALVMAEQSNKAKSDFLSNMSHDIRTPMNAIMNMTDFALESVESPEKQREYLQVIKESSSHLLDVINDVLDMSRIESGQTVIAHEPFDLKGEMLREVEMVAPLCAAKRQEFITDFERVSASVVYGDQLKLSQVIINLLANAIKFTPEGGTIRFSAEEVSSLREGIIDVRFTVEDTGIGISAKNIERIFEPFTRVDDKRVSRIEGTGLGLSICHSYVAAMGGVIQCESEEGVGSVFTVELFFQKAGVTLDKAETNVETFENSKMPFAGKRCLVAEDNHTNQIIAQVVLERLGFSVDMAQDGQEAYEQFCASQPGYYDCIYLDIQMPRMNGYETALAIRASDHVQASSITIVAMTANVFTEDVEKARLAGMDGHLGKPLQSSTVVEETSRALQREREREREREEPLRGSEENLFA